ncbi:hypothetical protein L7F22_064727 [Adiantum nelumboides]|nr:hypothetical protein [Adiantum nelumboides]
MTELRAEPATQQRTCQHSNSRPKNVGNKRRCVGGKAKTSEEQWVDIASSMASSGAFVEWRVANDKWKHLSQIHKEIADWERNIPSGKSTYWQMSPRERKEEGKFGHLNFERDIFDAMECRYGRDPMVDPPPSLIDTTNSSNLCQHQRGSSTPASAAVSSELGEECTNFDQTPDNSGVQKKTRKRTHMYDVGLKDAIKDISAALGAVEDSRDSSLLLG